MNLACRGRVRTGQVVLRICASVALLVALSACGSDGPDAHTADAASVGSVLPATRPSAATTTVELSVDDTQAAPNGQTVDVQALDNSFRVETIEISAGTEVHWENRGRNDHNIMPALEGQSWGIETEGFVPGDEYSTVFGIPGAYPYFCSIHGTKDVGMIGTVVVLPADS